MRPSTTDIRGTRRGARSSVGDGGATWHAASSFSSSSGRRARLPASALPAYGVPEVYSAPGVGGGRRAPGGGGRTATRRLRHQGPARPGDAGAGLDGFSGIV